MGLIKDLYDLKMSPVRPFHDDPSLQAFIRQIVKEKGIQTFVETGTFRGDSLVWFAEQFPDLRCLSCEKKRLYYLWSFGKTSGLKNVRIAQQDSREFLLNLKADHLSGGPVRGPVLFWLDAHWEDDWPLLQELETIQKQFWASVVLIDDFQIPGRPEFGFDTYNGKALAYSYIRDSLISPGELWYPDYSAPKDARGVCALFFGVKGVGEPLFRRAG